MSIEVLYNNQECALSVTPLYREVGVRGKGLLVPVSWGRGSDAPPASTQVAHALSASFWGKGLLVPVCWGRGSDAPPASTDVAHAPSASFWREGVLLMCGERNPIKGGVSSILFLSCSAIILLTQIILQVCGDL